MSASKGGQTTLFAPCLLEGRKCEDCPSSDLTGLIEKELEGERVLMFSKSYCPFCKRVKALFAEHKIPYTVVELDELEGDRGQEIQGALRALSGQRTVPNIFVGGDHVGGASETLAQWESGELAALLKKHDIVPKNVDPK